MSTPEQLVEAGALERLDLHLDPGELPQRMIYALPRVRRWIAGDLPGLQTDGYHEGAPSPAQQVDECLTALALGEEPGDLPPHLALPKEQGIWELRTCDLRLFGWFWNRSVFILSSIDRKDRMARGHIPTSNYVRQAIGDRDRLDLDEPKFLPGGPDVIFPR